MSDYFDRDEFRNDFDDPTKDIDDDLDRSPYVDCWKGYKEEIKNADLRTLQELANTDKIDPGFALQVVNNLYLYNSTVNIIKNSKDNKLLVLPESEVVIDLFNPTKELFVGKENNVIANECIKDILSIINCPSYHFYFREEALNAIKTIRNICKPPKKSISKGEILFQGTFWGEVRAYESILNNIFHGKWNWNMFPYDKSTKDLIEHSLYPYNVICFESPNDINEINNYCIYSKTNLNRIGIKIDDSFYNRYFILFSLISTEKSGGGFKGIKFLGVYKLDKGKSIEDDYLSLKLKDEVFVFPEYF